MYRQSAEVEAEIDKMLKELEETATDIPDDNVSDAEGLSFYSDERICEELHFSLNGLWKARKGLVQGGFLLYSQPIYQLLNLPELPPWE